MKILVTGAKGQVGSEIKSLSKSFDAEFIFTDLAELDITNKEGILNLFKEHDFDYCINCVAYTAVDNAEENQIISTAVNAKGVQNLAEACEKIGATLIHISSDYVYHNEVNRPLKETDPTEPKGVYASTKLQGDFAALNYNKSIILRTSWVYSSFGNNFVKSMIKYGTERDSLNIVFDQIGTPTYARMLAENILIIINHCEAGNAHYGVFNFSNEGVCSWYDFALEIFRIKGITCNVKPILSKDYPTPAQRPPFSVMDKSKIKETYNLNIPHWRDSLNDCLNLIINSEKSEQ